MRNGKGNMANNGWMYIESDWVPTVWLNLKDQFPMT